MGRTENVQLKRYVLNSPLSCFFSRNYNYRSASDALTGDSATFCEQPDLIATEPKYAWGAGVFFWMEK